MTVQLVGQLTAISRKETITTLPQTMRPSLSVMGTLGIWTHTSFLSGNTLPGAWLWEI